VEITSKDDILTRLTAVEKDLQVYRNDYRGAKETLDSYKDLAEKVEEEYRRIQEEARQARDRVAQAVTIVSDISKLGKQAEAEQAQLKRQLQRILDAEVINDRYQEQVDEFRNRCLEAYWRAENRTDGYGAYRYQIEGAIHLAVAQQAILGDKQGLGKSLTSLIYADFLGAQKIILVVPSDVMGNYIREINMWAPHRAPIQLGKMTPGQRNAVLGVIKHQPQYTLVMNYEIARRDKSIIEDLIELKCDTLIVDEAHNVKSTKSDAWKMVRDIRFGVNTCVCDNPMPMKYGQLGIDYMCNTCGKQGGVLDFVSIKNVLPMTGTPILNRPQELYPLLHLVDSENFASESQFLKDFCHHYGGSHWGWQEGGTKRLLEKIGPRFLARDKQMVGDESPPPALIEHIITEDEWREGYPQQYEAYQQVREYAQLILDPDNEVTMSMVYKIAALTRMRQVMSWPAAIKLEIKDEKSGIVTYSKNLDVYESVVLDKAESIIREQIDMGERVVLFSQFREPLEVLQRRLGDRAVVYAGGMKDSLKQAIQLDFDPKTAPLKPRWDVVLVNYKSGGVGLNFNAAAQAILMDYEWNAGKEDQAIGRLDRIGQVNDVSVHIISVEKTIYKWMRALINEKRDLTAGFVDQQKLIQSAYDALRDGDM
jgi:SNF2 family DNA or RNA helicase